VVMRRSCVRDGQASMTIRSSIEYLLRTLKAYGWFRNLFERAVRRGFRACIMLCPEYVDDDSPARHERTGGK
jgi:hypothetical protein